MPQYNIHMGQAIIVDNLNENCLCTGLSLYGDAGAFLSSCSAVIMANRKTHCAGIYHYPAGRLNDGSAQRVEARKILDQMCDHIKPDLVVIRAGSTSRITGQMYSLSQKQIEKEEKNAGSPDLKVYLDGKGLNSVLMSNKTGVASVFIKNGEVVHTDDMVDTSSLFDLQKMPAGQHNGYLLLGSAQ